VLHGVAKDKDKLPGSENYYNTHPPVVAYYDIFYFETRMRDMIQECVEHLRVSAKEDKELAVQLRHDYDSVK